MMSLEYFYLTYSAFLDNSNNNLLQKFLGFDDVIAKWKRGQNVLFLLQVVPFTMNSIILILYIYLFVSHSF